MKFNEIIKDLTPGEVIHCGKQEDYNFIEIFVLKDGSFRFSEDTMMLDNNILSSDNWEK